MIFPDGTIFPSKSDITIPSNGTTTDTFKFVDIAIDFER